MAKLTIPVGEFIGPSYVDWDEFEFVQGFTVDDIRMRKQWLEYDGQTVDEIELQIGICYGGIVRHALEIYNYVRGLGVPVSCHVLSLAASSATIVALAADTITLEHTAQWMVHRPLFPAGTYSQRSAELRADADRLDRDEQNVVDIYVASTGQSEEAVRTLLSADRFMSAAEALDFGFITTVKPLAAKTPAAKPAQAQARLRTYRQAVARTTKHVQATLRKPTPKPNATTGRVAASIPMAKNALPIRQAAAKAAGKKATPAALTPAQKAVQALAKSLNVSIKMEGEAATAEAEEPTTEVVATKLKDQDASLYSDGELAEGVAVFNNEALTEPTDNGVYGTEDGRDVTITDGVVESIVDTPEAEAEAPADIAALVTAAVAEGLKPFTARLDAVEARFHKAVPPVPKARATTGSQVADPKAGARPQAKGLLKGASTQRPA